MRHAKEVIGDAAGLGLRAQEARRRRQPGIGAPVSDRRISTFDLSRYMGASLTMIGRHYGHLARDGGEHAIRLLDGYADIKAASRR
jgi:hypothetical protein